MKNFLLVCAGVLTVCAAIPAPALAADDPAAQNAAVAHDALQRTKADTAHTRHYTRKAIAEAAAARKTRIARNAEARKHRLAASTNRREHHISATAQHREAAISNSAAAQEHALDAQHP